MQSVEQDLMNGICVDLNVAGNVNPRRNKRISKCLNEFHSIDCNTSVNDLIVSAIR